VRHSAMRVPLLFGPYGSSALTVIDRLVGYGVNACWFHMFNPAAFDACAKHGIAACVEFKTLRADFSERPELIPIGADGQPIRYGDLVQGVCLSQREFRAEIEESLLQGVREFQPSGIWLDYLTYAGWFETPEPDLQESCFCPNCIADFCEATGVDATTSTEISGLCAAGSGDRSVHAVDLCEKERALRHLGTGVPCRGARFCALGAEGTTDPGCARLAG
jgi:hypothetical protein